MANIRANSGNDINTGTLSFDVFSQDQIFRAAEIKKAMTDMVKIMEDQAEFDEASSEMHRRKKTMLKEGVNALKDEATIRRKIFDQSVYEKGVLAGTYEILKKTKELSVDTYKHRRLVALQEKEIVKLEDQLKKMRDMGSARDREAEKHIARMIRDEKQMVAVQQIKQRAMIEAHPLGPAIGKYLSGSGGRALFSVASMLGNVFGTIIDWITKLVKGVFNAFVTVLKDLVGMWLKIQTIIGNVSADLGLTEYQVQQINNNVGKIGLAAAQWGVNIEEAFMFMRRFSEITGLNHVLLVEQVSDLSAIAKVTGLGVEQTAQMYANLELIGYSTADFRRYTEATRKEFGMLGLNVTKILTTVNQLLPAFYALNFKDSLEGLTAVVARAQSLRFELTNMRNLAVQLFNPEGAIELAAKVRVLGGTFAKMADPFSLMLKAQTDAAGLMNDVMDTFAGAAIKNAKGIFEIPPVQQALIREFAAATGESVDNLTKGILQQAKMTDIAAQLRSRGIINESDIKAVQNMAELIDGKYYVKIDAMGTKKALDEVVGSMNLRKMMFDFVREEQQVATTRMNLVEQLRNLYNMFLFSLQPIFRPIEALFKDSRVMAQLQATMTQVGQLISNALMPMLGGGSGLYNYLLEAGKGVASFLKSLGDLLAGKTSFVDIISTTIVEIIRKVWDLVKTMLRDFSKTEAGQKVVSGVGTAGGVAGALGGAWAGAKLGTAIGALFGGVGAPVGGAIGAIAGGLGGYFTGRGAARSMVSGGADDFIMRGNQITKFNKDDIVMGGTKLIPSKPEERTANMQLARDLLTQVKRYDKQQFAPLTMAAGGYGAPQKVTLDISGTLQIKGEKESAYLTSADLKNIGIQHLTYAVMNEADRFKNHQSGKRLQSEIITPIRTT